MYLFIKHMMMEYKQIKTQGQYQAVAARIEQLKDAEPGTNEAKELKLLMRLLVEFEMKRPAASPEQSQMT